MAAVTATSSIDFRRRHSVVDPNYKPMLPPVAMASSNVYSSEPGRSSLDFHRQPQFSRSGSISGSTSSLPSDEDDNMPPTPGTDILTRASRSTSSASRNNRLSLTLPIAPPTSDPSRPTPGANSFPPTPLASVQASTPADTNDFIIAIAAQERRVLELKEELLRAEAELSQLKRQWTTHEAYKKRDPQPFPPITPIDDSAASRMSQELDRRKLLMNLQRSPNEGRRKVFRGGHARTLSLLSPTKPEPDYSLLDGPIEELRHSAHNSMSRSQSLHQVQNAYSSAGASNQSKQNRRSLGHTSSVSSITGLSKRATWQPRIAYPSSNVGMSQIVEDLKLGFRTFYDDIRQITVGDEPVTGRRANGSYIYNSNPIESSPPPSTAPASATRAHGAGKPHPYDPDILRTAAAATARSQAGFDDDNFAESPVTQNGSVGGQTATGTDESALAVDTPGKTANPHETSAAASTTSASSAPSTARRRSRECERRSGAGSRDGSGSNGRPNTGHRLDNTPALATPSKPKHFSWTPLSFDALDDNDWSNWESPGSIKSTRWSGSTMGDSDAIPSVGDEPGTAI
ncbi:hypothetical protein CFIMG_008138RA00001 [Ceratocystis fimbriata CBS 114723]|uniref:Uncharacterized protein n=1 Tax=Ceratocystis fimbriata CBS 114723 TaxID=1035309 RepID=A0A2C5X5D9_9PEZI|nr:hypothetical protein CFIMG_008138RA00001 [Ceratocystis fimbriata CBS 114723]